MQILRIEVRLSTTARFWVPDSEEHRLAIRAEHIFERSANLVQRAIGARAFEDERHDIVVAARRFPQRIETLRARALVASAAQLRHAFALLDLRFRAHRGSES